MAFGNSGGYNNDGGFNGGGYNGGNGGYYNGGGRGAGGGLVCPKCGSNNCHAQLRKSGDNLVMFDSARNTNGILGLLFGGIHSRTNSYASFAICNSCGYSWQVGKEPGRVGILAYIVRIVLFFAVGYSVLWFIAFSSPNFFHLVVASIVSLAVLANLLSGCITDRFFTRGG